MSAIVNVQKEVQALHCIAERWSDFGNAPGMWQLDRYFSIEFNEDGNLEGSIDFYSQRLPDSEGWDADAYEEEKLILRLKPCRKNFRDLYQMVRILLGGGTCCFDDGGQLSRESHLSEVRESRRQLGKGQILFGTVMDFGCDREAAQ